MPRIASFAMVVQEVIVWERSGGQNRVAAREFLLFTTLLRQSQAKGSEQRVPGDSGFPKVVHERTAAPVDAVCTLVCIPRTPFPELDGISCRNSLLGWTCDAFPSEEFGLHLYCICFASPGGVTRAMQAKQN